MHGVTTSDGHFLAAIAELPLSTRRADGAEGSIVVLSGTPGWGKAARRAEEDGALAVVVDALSTLDAEEIQAAVDVAGRLPVAVARPRLRSDVGLDALGAPGTTDPRVVSVECSAPGGEIEAALRDALGWARILARGTLRVQSSDAVAGGVTALLGSDRAGADDGCPVTVLAAHRRTGESWLRVLATDSSRVEVTVEGPYATAAVAVAGAEGVLRSPQRFESYRRLALRAAIAAVERRELLPDASELQHDSRLAALLLEG